ncbi:MAG TPA: exodeoxyribonuclease VII large subunit [Longimicrobiales bacterium]|nr:exodeoxyribonuclease VII large subunit [Longimicrobiales bacterium]
MQESFDFGSKPPRRDRPEPIVVLVGQLNQLVKDTLESIPALWVEGEVSGWKRYSSGHCYFTIKDRDAQVSAVMFASDAQRLPAAPEEGMRVRAYGRVTLYEKRGSLQVIVKRIEATGDGGLFKLAFERLRLKLDAEGLLAPERRRPLPRYPRTVGVVTSPVGAALHDILHVIRRRAPWTRVVLSPARVQGDGAAYDIARALRLFERTEVDVVIVGRGGGSVEDLWAFNEEPVARAIVQCSVPVISAVGHETDVTIADLVADLRAPTPSAAAESAVPDGAVLRQELVVAQTRLARSLRRFAVRRREQLDVLDQRMTRRMRRLVEARTQQLTWAGERMEQRVRRVVQARKAALATLAGQVDALSPLQSLVRGFAVPLGPHGGILRRRDDFVPGAPFTLRVVDGDVPCRVDGDADE